MNCVSITIRNVTILTALVRKRRVYPRWFCFFKKNNWSSFLQLLEYAEQERRLDLPVGGKRNFSNFLNKQLNCMRSIICLWKLHMTTISGTTTLQTCSDLPLSTFPADCMVAWLLACLPLPPPPHRLVTHCHMASCRGEGGLTSVFTIWGRRQGHATQNVTSNVEGWGESFHTENRALFTWRIDPIQK